jgi:hypothetical protein
MVTIVRIPALFSLKKRTIRELSEQNCTSSAVVGGIDVPDKYLLPDKIYLGNNFPNLFSPATTFRYWLLEKMTVKLAVYDLQGELVETLFKGTQTADPYQLVWNAQHYPLRNIFLPFIC